VNPFDLFRRHGGAAASCPPSNRGETFLARTWPFAAACGSAAFAADAAARPELLPSSIRGQGFILGSSCYLLHANQVRDTRQHPAGSRAGRAARCWNRSCRNPIAADRAAVLRLSCRSSTHHRYFDSLIDFRDLVLPPRRGSRCCEACPLYETSSATFPRSFATSSGRQHRVQTLHRRAAYVCGFADPSDCAEPS